MGLEDKHLDVLQNIEFAIVEAYRDNPTIRDIDVIHALESLVKNYHLMVKGKTSDPPANLSGKARQIYDNIVQTLAFRGELTGSPTPKKSFSRALRPPTKEEIFLACLRKVEKSAKRWNKTKGERGYLDFVKNYVP